MYTDVNTPGLEMLKPKTDHEYIHILQTRGDIVRRDRKVLAKTPEEKKIATEVKKDHRAFLRSHGYSHKTRLNISDPMTTIYTCLD